MQCSSSRGFVFFFLVPKYLSLPHLVIGNVDEGSQKQLLSRKRNWAKKREREKEKKRGGGKEKKTGEIPRPTNLPGTQLTFGPTDRRTDATQREETCLRLFVPSDRSNHCGGLHTTSTSLNAGLQAFASTVTFSLCLSLPLSLPLSL